MAMITVKRIETIILDINEVLRREQTLARLIMVAAQRRWHKKKSNAVALKLAKRNPPKDQLDSVYDSDL